MNTEGMTPRQHATILAEYLEEGKTVKEFCEDYKVAPRYASGVILRFKIRHKFGRSRRFTDRMVQQWISLYNRGVSLQQIARRMGTTTAIVSGFLQAYEVHEYRQRLSSPDVQLDLQVYKSASREAADYWIKRSPKFYKYWKKEIEEIEREARGAQIAGANG
jgi:predicted transcriptional regulator